MMDLQPIVPWLSAIALLISLGTSITTFFTAGSKKNAQRIEELETELSRQDGRIQAIESEMKHLPDRNMIHELQLTLKDMQVDMAALKTTAEQAATISRRLEDFLLYQSKGAS